MAENYELLQTQDGPGWVRSSALPDLREIDAIVFDCDGVLVDTRESYDAAIAVTADQLLQTMVGVRLPWKGLAPRLVTSLRRTGGFNNDWDSTYALVLFSVLAIPETFTTRFADGSVPNRGKCDFSFSSEEIGTVASRIETIVQDFCSSLTSSSIGWRAVNEFLQRKNSDSKTASAIAKAQERVAYPGRPPASLLATIFDETYHGPKLFREMYRTQASHYRGRGLIENERLLIRRADLDAASKLVGKRNLAMATGRPYLATQHILRDIMNYFNREASVFIGDMDVYPELAATLAPYQKPSGRSLIRARQTLSSDMVLYVGDSAADVKMAEDARQSKEPVVFAGIYGKDHTEESDFFRKREADLILPTARQVPVILRLVRNEKRDDQQEN